MHLCCESTRFEHRVIVDRGANETCLRSAGVRSARGSEEREQHDARHRVESAGCASATLPHEISVQGSAFSDQSLLFAFSIHESGSHPVSSQDGQSQGSARQSCVQRAGRVALRRADARAHRCPSTLCRQGPRPRGGVGRRPRADGQGQTAGSNCRCEVS
jgi:hypothetical protein